MADPNDAPQSGAIPYALGQPAAVRIPIPGTNGLCFELSPRGHVPKGGSTSTLFFQDKVGKRTLRLDYGWNARSKTIDYHWNQSGTFETFKIADHTTVGAKGAALYQSAKYFKYAGRTIMIVGAAADLWSITQASKPMRRATEVVSAWALAWAGCRTVGAGGASVGRVGGGWGIAIGGVGGCIIGGAGGYFGGERLGGTVYDWAEGTYFTPLPEAAGP